MRKLRLRTLRRVALFLLLLILGVVIYRWISLERWHWRLLNLTGPESEWAEPLRATPTPKPTRPPAITGKLDTARLFNGITFHSEVETLPGAAASVERIDPQSYAIDLKLRARVPTANKTIDELAKVSPDLPKLLPGLSAMVKPDSVSPFFAKLYETKVASLRANLGRLDQLLSRHNFYDCQTVLALQNTETKRKVVLMQADMDVDADGSDSDRLPIGSGASPNFKPFTSFRWGKKTSAPNPYLAGIQNHLDVVEEGLVSATGERKRELRDARTELRSEIETLKKFSFLIGATDPYIVIPTGFAGPTGGRIGDYCVVVAGENIYPAIVGDAGPPDKVGEASLRIAREINPLATPNNRPVSELKVTYLIFPGTADRSFGPPDLEKLQARCESLVKEIGGASVPLHHWENMIPPPPSPTPSPTATPSTTPAVTTTPPTAPTASPAPTFAFPIESPTPSATATTSPGVSLTPSASPSATPTP